MEQEYIYQPEVELATGEREVPVMKKTLGKDFGTFFETEEAIEQVEQERNLDHAQDGKI